MMYCLVDGANMIWRARHGAGRGATIDDVVGIGLMTTFRSMNKVFQKFRSDHAVACFDHMSWRKVVLEGYKASRRSDLDDAGRADVEKIIETIDHFRKFLEEKTNVTVLQSHLLEADDLIARWIAKHPDDDHVIVSTDSDYVQLVSDRVSLYNGIESKLYTIDGVYYQDGMAPKKKQKSAVIHGEVWKVKMVEVKGEKVPETVDPKWELFEKVVRGDKGDDVPSAVKPYFPSAQIRAAYAGGPGCLTWVNMMGAYRTDLPKKEDGTHPTVQELYDRNRMLIDLTQQPPEILQLADDVIESVLASSRKKGKVGMAFMEFCRDNGLIKLGQEAERLAPMLAKPHPRAS